MEGKGEVGVGQHPKCLPVKVCGITRAEDGQAAIQAGASALGFIFYPPSPRYISPERVASMILELPASAVKVGVFVGTGAEDINRVVAQCGLNWVQLHGGEPADLMAQLNCPAYRAFRLKEQSDMAMVNDAPDRMVLLDTFDPDHYGGTGRPFNWDWARKIAAGRQVILAGGLTPGNAVRAVGAACPAGLDVSSGVETSPGIKDAAKLAEFFYVLREAGYSGPSPWSMDDASGIKD